MMESILKVICPEIMKLKSTSRESVMSNKIPKIIFLDCVFHMASKQKKGNQPSKQKEIVNECRKSMEMMKLEL